MHTNAWLMLTEIGQKWLKKSNAPDFNIVNQYLRIVDCILINSEKYSLPNSFPPEASTVVTSKIVRREYAVKFILWIFWKKQNAVEIKLPFNTKTSVSGEATTMIDAPQKAVFAFVAENYFENYPKWAPEIVEVSSLSGERVRVGVKGKQVREENGEQVESAFVIDEYLPDTTFSIQGLTPAFKSIYATASREQDGQTRLTFRFELFDIDIFMRPFVKLLKAAIEEGAENTVEKIKELITNQHGCRKSQ